MIGNVASVVWLGAGAAGWIVQLIVWLTRPGEEEKASAECRMAILFGISAAAGLVWALATHNHFMAYVTAVSLACCVGWWIHNNRKRRKRRSARALGEKGRALIAAPVRKVRESAKPRPVLRPVPGGVS